MAIIRHSVHREWQCEAPAIKNGSGKLRESYVVGREMGLGGFRKTIKESQTGNQFYTLTSSMPCPLRESDFPMVLSWLYLLLHDWTTEVTGRTTDFRRLEKIYGFMRIQLAQIHSSGLW